MFDYQTVKLMHSHGDERFPMTESSHHDAAEHDPERGWRPGARFFRCTGCHEEIVVESPEHDVPDAEPG
jgi:hypothetical protein